jgi:hypothetical protein
MKKNCLFIFSLMLTVGFLHAQCVINRADTAFFSPNPDSLPCVERTVAYNQILQIHIPASINLQDFGAPISYILNIDSVVIDSVKGMPTGISYQINPSNGILYGDSNACATLSGTTTDTTGNYLLTFYGIISLSGAPFPPIFSGDTTVKLQQIQASPMNPFHAVVNVINIGDTCRPPAAAGISNFNNPLNAVIAVYPNPSNGVFELKINAGGRLAGEIIVADVTGRVILRRQVDAMGLYETSLDLSGFSKGLYTLQVRTPNGFASKNISIE